VVKTSVYLSKGARSFYAEDYGTFSAVSIGGSGAGIVAFPHGITALIVKASHPGSGAFRVSELGTGGLSTGRVPISVTGAYHGGVAIGLTRARMPTTSIRITGIGAWRITLVPVAAARVLTRTTRGTGDQVLLYSGPTAIWTVSSPGPTTFVLNQISSSSLPNHAVDESGNWAGKIGLQPGPSVIEISSNGSWAVS
jgi:hypothetical protein